ncbi:MAG: NAD(P)H-hydrate dehydratase [Flavobacteriaceae bacterium]|nr:NAD(P)H-hydrate dehydratase [Flavobacteriaceae bacterium]
MKILSSNQMYQADQATIKNRPIRSIDLMEDAAMQCVDWLLTYLKKNKQPIYIFCGVGNNGGDGLVIARKLIQANFNVKTYIVKFNDKKSNDFNINFKRLVDIDHCPIALIDSSKFPLIIKNAIVIDAIFGIGLSRPPSGFVKKTIQAINSSKSFVIAVDIPSGLFVEKTVTYPESVIRANHTLTFQNPKLAFYLSENKCYIGDWTLLDICLDINFIDSLESVYATISLEQIKTIHRPRKKYSHKGTFGHSLIIGGSFGKIGAVVLASKAALKIGSGLVTSYIPKCGYNILQTSNPEVMVEVDDEKYLQYFNYKTNPNVIGIGVGLGTHIKTINGFENFLKRNSIPLVIDADALNILSKQKGLLELIPKNSVLTPHPKEFERLVGSWNNDYEKLDLLLKFSKKHQIVVVLKGANSAIAYQNKIYFNTTGNPALATAGSGDVLTGMITGLMAQNYNALNASILGVYLHGKTADIAIRNNYTMETFIASDSVHLLPNAIKEIF